MTLFKPNSCSYQGSSIRKWRLFVCSNVAANLSETKTTHSFVPIDNSSNLKLLLVLCRRWHCIDNTASNGRRTDEGFIKKLSWLNGDTTSAFLWMDWVKPRNTSVRITGIPAEVQTQHLSFAFLQDYRPINLLFKRKYIYLNLKKQY
jgi:hypothetical protein